MWMLSDGKLQNFRKLLVILNSGFRDMEIALFIFIIVSSSQSYSTAGPTLFQWQTICLKFFELGSTRG